MHVFVRLFMYVRMYNIYASVYLFLEFITTNTHLSCVDTCKFLHDRSDYKSGWQLDMEWNEQRYGTQGMCPVPDYL